MPYLLIELCGLTGRENKILKVGLRSFTGPEDAIGINGGPFVGKVANGDCLAVLFVSIVRDVKFRVYFPPSSRLGASIGVVREIKVWFGMPEFHNMFQFSLNMVDHIIQFSR